MSGELHRPGSPAGSPPGSAARSAPLCTPDQAQVLLDHVIYEQVLECVDVDALYEIEQMLILHISELEGIDHDRACEVARSMLDRAVLRLPEDIRTYLSAVAFMQCKGCVLCEQEAREAARSRPQRRRTCTES